MDRTAPQRRAATALLLILAAAAALRFSGLRTEPWLDEVWSIRLARKAASAADVFLKLHDDNNNPLNTLYLHLVPDGVGWARYRLLAYASGLLTVALLGWDPEDPARGLLTATLAAVSTQMILYGTEARGYALMALFSVACFRLLRAPEPLTRPRAAAFSLCALLAFLSHPTFVYVFSALAAWTAVKLPAEKRARGLIDLFLPPTAIFGLYELLQFPLTMDGANPTSLTPILARTLSLWSGASFHGAAALLGGAAALGLLGGELRNMRRERPDEFVFYVVLFSGALAFVAALPFRFERHFFACLPFVLLLAASALMRLLRRGGGVRLAAVVAILLFIIGNGRRDLETAVDGRGRYLEAVQRMAADTPGETITVSSDHDVRNKMMLDFYGAFLPPGKRIVYIPSESRPRNLPDWFLLHSFQTDPRTAPISVAIDGPADYDRVDVYPYGGLSGFRWMLYRRRAK